MKYSLSLGLPPSLAKALNRIIYMREINSGDRITMGQLICEILMEKCGLPPNSIKFRKRRKPYIAYPELVETHNEWQDLQKLIKKSTIDNEDKP